MRLDRFPAWVVKSRRTPMPGRERSHVGSKEPEDIMRTPAIIQRSLAEALGTFILVFVGSGTATAATLLLPLTPAIRVLLTALGLGLALFAGISIVGKISGGHYNPAVTVGLAAAGRFDWIDVPGYLIGQVAGAIVGALAILIAYGRLGARIAGLGAPGLAPSINIWQGLFIEGLGTAVLVLAVMGTAVDTRAVAGWAPLAIGLTLSAIILFIGAATGGSVNPARAFGPDLVAVFFGFPVNWAAFVVSYLIGPLLGGIVGAVGYLAVAPLPRPDRATSVGGRRPQAVEPARESRREPSAEMSRPGDFDERSGLPAS
jgi:MIP family channel proteins